jgi:hypothetical protein
MLNEYANLIHGVGAQEAELERFIDSIAPCPAWRRRSEAVMSTLGSLPRRALRKATCGIRRR